MAEKKPTKDSVLMDLLQAHARREKRSVDGTEHEYIVYDDGCDLCTDARQVLHVKGTEQEIELGSDPPKPLQARRTARRRRKVTPDQRPGPHPERRSPAAPEGDATPAGYRGHPGPDLLQDRTMTTDKANVTPETTEHTQ